MLYIFIYVYFFVRETSIFAILIERRTGIIPRRSSMMADLIGVSLVPETNSIIATHRNIDPDDIWFYSLGPIFLRRVLELSYPRLRCVKESADIFSDEYVAVHKNESVAQDVEHIIYAENMPRASVIIQPHGNALGIALDNLIERDDLLSGIIDDIYALHLRERTFVRIVKDRYPATGTVLVDTPYTGCRQFRCIEMNDCYISRFSFHNEKIKGRVFARPLINK